MSPGPIFEPEGFGADWWRTARALFAAGFRKGDIVHNSFAYHLTPGGWILEAGAHALGCAVIPAGPGNTEQQLDAIQYLKPTAYIGMPDFLKILLDKAKEAGKDASCFKKALVGGGALFPSLRAEYKARGIDTYQCYAIADLGIIAYESAALEGMIVDEGVIVEIVRPGTGDPRAGGRGRRGRRHHFQPRLSDDPVCHRRSVRRAAGCEPVRAHQHAHQGLDGPRRPDHQGQGHVRASRAGRGGGQAARRARPRAAGREPRRRAGRHDLACGGGERRRRPQGQARRDACRRVTKLKGEVELVAPGSLPNDGKVIADERTYT